MRTFIAVSTNDNNYHDVRNYLKTKYYLPSWRDIQSEYLGVEIGVESIMPLTDNDIKNKNLKIIISNIGDIFDDVEMYKNIINLGLC